MDFGFTNDDSQFEAAVRFREAAIADGWDVMPTYPQCEPVESAATLKREGYTLMILTRQNEGKWKYQASVSLWGPDRLAIRPPREYDFEAIQRGTTTCLECGAKGVETTRVGFAGRSCNDCLPEARKKHEYRGWCD